MNEPMMNDAAPAAGQVMERDTPEVSEARAALVNRWLKDVAEARKHWEPDFKRMRRNMKFAGGEQWPGQRENDDRFRVNLIQRVLKTMVASLYAKNPTITYKRRPTLDFTLWDGKAETLMQAQQAVAMATQAAADPAIQAAAPVEAGNVAAIALQAQALLADVQQGMDHRRMMDKIGKTLISVMHYYLEEGVPSFKTQMKQMVRRARTCGVGYVKLGFQRAMELSERQAKEVASLEEKLALIGQLKADIADGEIDPTAAEAEELRLAIQTVQSQPEQIVSEGLVFSFPGSTKLIPSISTEKLMGWVGSEWIAEEIMLTPDRIKRIYGVDVGKSYTSYRTVPGSPTGQDTRRIADRGRKDALACVYHIFDKTTGMELVVCEGYPDFLKEPSEPSVFIEPFFPFFAVTFNDVEEEGRLFPDSDVENLTHIQREYNRSHEARRQHRIANRPLYLTGKGVFEEDEVKSLENYPAHSVIELNSLNGEKKAQDVLQPVAKIGVDPNLYETDTLFQDMQRVTGNSAANLGGTAGDTATESSIAESSRQGSIGLDSDDLDDMLTMLMRCAGQVLLTELDAETVKGIAGVGAVWPELSRQEVAAELWLEVKAGSSGRPNAAQEIANFERLYPLIVQVPGVSPRWLAEKAVRLADDDVDLEDAIADGLPSITAMNQQAQPNQSPNDPNQQGNEGANNAPKPKPARDNGQPGYNAGPTN